VDRRITQKAMQPQPLGSFPAFCVNQSFITAFTRVLQLYLLLSDDVSVAFASNTLQNAFPMLQQRKRIPSATQGRDKSSQALGGTGESDGFMKQFLLQVPNNSGTALLKPTVPHAKWVTCRHDLAQKPALAVGRQAHNPHMVTICYKTLNTWDDYLDKRPKLRIHTRKEECRTLGRDAM
jgi:hypothetical protein